MTRKWLLIQIGWVLLTASPLHATDTQLSIDQLRLALQSSPNSAAAKQNLSIALTNLAHDEYQKQQTDTALQNLNEAVSLAPQNGPAWFMLGDIFYIQKSDFKNAVACWNKALPLAPEVIRTQILSRLSKAELDKQLERGFASLVTPHFEIRFPDSFPKAEAQRIGDYMEGDYKKLSLELQVNPPQITVAIYEKSGFDRITGDHDETLGLYDGRIRIGTREIRTPYERLILSHELAHAFLQNAYGASLPIWIQEGYAQAKEPERILTDSQKEMEAQLETGNSWIPLKWLDRKFLQPGELSDITRAYLQARLAIAYVLENDKDRHCFKGFLEGVSKGQEAQTAFRASCRDLSWNDLEYGRFSRNS